MHLLFFKEFDAIAYSNMQIHFDRQTLHKLVISYLPTLCPALIDFSYTACCFTLHKKNHVIGFQTRGRHNLSPRDLARPDFAVAALPSA